MSYDINVQDLELPDTEKDQRNQSAISEALENIIAILKDIDDRLKKGGL